ncbi:MAG TPA: acetyl-CoA C-acetyltransferase [Mycobacteriales bacterium]|nr:acetyl-CoA C-acetyltransferase [Mycobacteriales bacterium]
MNGSAQLNDHVICSPVRTPVGRFAGSLKPLQAHELAAQLLRALLDRTGLPGDRVDDVVFAQCYPTMEAPAIGRVAGLDAGLPIEIGGMQLDRRCGSGLQAVILASMEVATGAAELVIAGGCESMSNASLFTHDRWGVTGDGIKLHDTLARGRVTAGGKNFPVPGGMIETAENLRREYSIGRQEQDELAARSHARAVAAQQSGAFADEIAPVVVPDRKGEVTVSADEHPRSDTTVEVLSTLTPLRAKVDPESTVTAGNASGQNDGAAACIVTTPELAAELGLTPMARIVSWAVAGVEPARMGIGPVPSTLKALDKAGLSMDDMDLIELNEAFAAQVLAVLREWKLSDADLEERFNVNGSGISLGHPVGATGVRILATLLYEMRRRGSRYGLETMCIGGGQGLTAVLERV